MSHIGKLRPTDCGADYFAALIAKTRRDDDALLARFGTYPATDEDSAELLRALRARWPLDHFDELNIAVSAPYHPRLKRALGFVGPRVCCFGGGLMLSKGNVRDVARWILTVAGRDIGGLTLTRDAIGWCSVVGQRQ